MIRRMIVGLLAALGMLVVGVAPAQAARAAEPTFTVDTDLAAGSRVAALWSKTAVDVRVGDCAAGSAGCITVVVVESPCGVGALGCAYGWTYSTGCTVEIDSWVLEWSSEHSLPDFPFNVLGHEVGHCVIGSAWHDASSERSIMYASLHYGDRARGLTRAVRDRVAARWVT